MSRQTKSNPYKRMDVGQLIAAFREIPNEEKERGQESIRVLQIRRAYERKQTKAKQSLTIVDRVEELARNPGNKSKTIRHKPRPAPVTASEPPPEDSTKAARRRRQAARRLRSAEREDRAATVRKLRETLRQLRAEGRDGPRQRGIVAELRRMGVEA